MDLFPKILKEGVLIPLSKGHRYQWLNDTVFFSLDDDFEYSCLKGIERKETIELMTKEEQQKLFGIFRIGISINTPGLNDFARFAKQRNAPENELKSLINFWEEKGANPEDWFCIEGPVPKQRWELIELLENDEWILPDNFLDILVEMKRARYN
jgi:hypothetical protein